jgi:hypothetical protein
LVDEAVAGVARIWIDVLLMLRSNVEPASEPVSFGVPTSSVPKRVTVAPLRVNEPESLHVVPDVLDGSLPVTIASTTTVVLSLRAMVASTWFAVVAAVVVAIRAESTPVFAAAVPVIAESRHFASDWLV